MTGCKSENTCNAAIYCRISLIRVIILPSHQQCITILSDALLHLRKLSSGVFWYHIEKATEMNHRQGSCLKSPRNSQSGSRRPMGKQMMT